MQAKKFASYRMIVWAIVLTPFLGCAILKQEADFDRFDIRVQATGLKAELSRQRAIALENLRARKPRLVIDFDPVTGSPNSVFARGGYLARAEAEGEEIQTFQTLAQRKQAPVHPEYATVERFLNENRELFEHGFEMLTNAKVSIDYVTKHNGMRAIVWQQEVQGVPVHDAKFIAHIARNGALVKVSSQMVPNVEAAAGPNKEARAATMQTPAITASEAVVRAALDLGERLESKLEEVTSTLLEGKQKRLQLRASFLKEEARAELVWVPMNRKTLRLCWRTALTVNARPELFGVMIDAASGKVLMRHRLLSGASASYNVYTQESPTPMSPTQTVPSSCQPAAVEREVRIVESFLPGQPDYAWLPEMETRTIGNNADVRIDTRNDNTLSYDAFLAFPDLRAQSASRDFDFPLDLTQEPSANREAAVVNAFYWVNYIHDILYGYGFDEAAGNFQQNNFGKGGVGNDAILVDVQNNSEGTIGQIYNDNHYRSDSAADGSPARIELAVHNGPSPNRDAGFDAELVLHEYTHGVSERLVGKGTKFSQAQAYGLWEGWSDFVALTLLNNSESKDVNGNYAFGAYVARHWVNLRTSPAPPPLEENYYYGLRRYPYSTDLTKNPLTLLDIDQRYAPEHAGISRSSQHPYQVIKGGRPPVVLHVKNATEAHNQGEVWCSALWEARANLIGKYGFETGVNTVMTLVLDGMKLTPPNPNFLQARDAILQADEIDYGGTNLTELWSAFAKRGMGYSAVCPPSESNSGIKEATDLPPSSGVIWAYGSGNGMDSSPAVAEDGTIYIGGLDQKVHAVKPDGTVKWTYSPNTGWNFHSSPSIGADGTIYVGCYDSHLYALNPNGTLKWRTLLGGQVYASAAIGTDGTIYTAAVDTGRVYAIRPSDGLVLWTFQAANTVYSSPSVSADGWVYFGCTDRKVYAVNASTGAAKSGWPFTTGGFVISSPAIGVDGTVYVGSYDKKVYAIYPNGVEKWHQTTGGIVRSSPSVAPDGTVYVGSEDFKLYAFGSAGLLKWTYPTGYKIESSPAIAADGTILITSKDSKIYAVSPNGTLRWSVWGPAGMDSSPVIGADGRVYAGVESTTGSVIAVQNGSILESDGWPMFRKNRAHTGR